MKSTKKLNLFSSIEEVKGIGPKRALALKKNGITKVFNLLRIIPERYEDRSKVYSLASVKLSDSKVGLFEAKLKTIKLIRLKASLSIIKAVFEDSSTQIEARWFNQKYLIKQLVVGQYYYLFSKVIMQKGNLLFDNPDVERVEANTKKVCDFLVPVYARKKKLSEAKLSPLALRKLIFQIFEQLDWNSSLPTIDDESSYRAIKASIINLHMPKNLSEADKAKYTMSFFDQLLFQIGVLKRRECLTGQISLPNESNLNEVRLPKFKLPFKLTEAQHRVLKEIYNDLQGDENSIPMNRLLQGDVGSGKTIVAFISMFLLNSQYIEATQCAFMAPTEILARQHLKSFLKFFPELDNSTAVLTGSLKVSEKKLIYKRLETGEIRYLFGTHALFQEKVLIPNLKLCIIDEQQRFGVEHRKALVRKGKKAHQLLLTATPIPRTLSLTIFGDMDVSVIDELPPGRLPVTTRVFDNWSIANATIRNKIDKKEQVYVVCPLIESSEVKNWVSVDEICQTLQERFPQATISSLTGRNTWEEKEAVMNDFKNADIDIMVATTVVEVGVDCPNATLMIIQNAECFGLSQLHQLRGRIGRGSKQSECILIRNIDADIERLNILANTNDGFELSVQDLRLRGAGDLVGNRQSGLSHPCFSNPLSQKLIKNSRKRAFEILTVENDKVKDWFLRRMIESFGDNYKTFMEGG